MGRVKLPLKLIDCEKSRKITALKRTKGLKKKASELATLCGVEVCLICFGPERDQPELSPENMSRALSIVELYRKIPRDVREKNQLHLTDFMEAKVRKLKLEFEEEEKMEIHYPTWDDQLNDYFEEGLRNLTSLLDSKLAMVKERLRMVSSEEKWEEKSVVKVREAIQSLSNYLLGTVESRSHWPKEYIPLPITSSIDFSSLHLRALDHIMGPQYPCHPNNILPFSDMGFPAGLPDHSEFNSNLILHQLDSFGSWCNPGIGLLENTGFFAEKDMDNLFENKMMGSSQNAGIGMSVFSGEQDMGNLFHNKMVAYNNFNMGSYSAGLWQSGLNPPSTSLHDSSSFGSNEFQAGPFWNHGAGGENSKAIGIGNQYYFSGY